MSQDTPPFDALEVLQNEYQRLRGLERTHNRKSHARPDNPAHIYLADYMGREAEDLNRAIQRIEALDDRLKGKSIRQLNDENKYLVDLENCHWNEARLEAEEILENVLDSHVLGPLSTKAQLEMLATTALMMAVEES